MDFSQFDSRTTSDHGAPLHLTHPVSGKLLYDNDDATVPNDKPCRVWIKGTEGRDVQKALRTILRENVKKAEDLENGVEEQHRNLVRMTTPLITGFENINRNNALAKVPDDVAWFLDLQLASGSTNGGKSFAEQVVEFSTQRENYLGNSESAS